MNLLKEYAEKQMELAVHYLSVYAQSGNEEALHQLRVVLKKSRAVMHYFLHEKLHVKKVTKLKKDIRNIFHTAGSIRAAQLQMKWMKRNRYLILLQSSSLKNDLLYYNELFKTDAKKSLKILSDVKTKLVEHCSDSAGSNVLQHAIVLKQTIQSTIEILRQPGWHELRKTIKQLLYAYNWQLEKDKIKLLTVKEHTYLDQLQEAIGTWHDAEDLKLWMTDQQFFLNENPKVKLQFAKCWNKLIQEMKENEKSVKTLLNNKKLPMSMAPVT